MDTSMIMQLADYCEMPNCMKLEQERAKSDDLLLDVN